MEGRDARGAGAAVQYVHARGDVTSALLAQVSGSSGCGTPNPTSTCLDPARG